MKINKKYLIEKIASTIILVLLFNNLNAQEKFDEDMGILNVAISDYIILDMQDKDATAAIDFALNSVLGTDDEVVQKIRPEIVNSIDEIIKRVNENKADIIGIASYDYIEYDAELDVTPLFVVQRGPTQGTKYVIVTNSNSNINSLADLKSKKILTYADNELDLVNNWLFVEMKKENINNPLEIIDSFVEIPKPTKRVFSVFFGKADGCLLSKAQYDSMCELNTQIKNKLKILYESPNYLTNLFCSNNNSNKKGIALTKKFIEHMNNVETGNEILKLFKAVKYKIFEDDYLITIKQLYDEYNYYSKN
jgi:ABC-type phosphate/phosphonate transport system substrate-binding protein